MSKTKLIAAVILACAALPSYGQNAPLTLQEITNAQAEIKRAKWRAELAEAQGKSSGNAAPAPVERTCDEDLAMNAVYGIGSQLRADFSYRGAVVSMGPGDNADIGGWYVEQLSATRAVMVKKSSKKTVVKRCPLYLSAAVREVAPRPRPVETVSAGSLDPIPPIVAVDTPAKGAVAARGGK